MEELIRTLYNALVERGYSLEEIREILSGLFPEHAGFIEELACGDGKGPVIMLVVGAGILVLLLLFFVLRARRRKTGE